MQCPKCGLENRGNARFCGRCGATMPEAAASPARPQPARMPPVQAADCPVCGAALKPGARFCARCGTPFSEAASPASGHEAPPQPWSGAPPTQMAAPVAADWGMAPPDRGAVPAAWGAAPQADQGGARQSPLPSPLDVEPEPVGRKSRGGFAWVFALLAMVVSGCCVFSVVVGLAVGAAFGDTVAGPPESDPSQPDLTIYVGEAYVSEMMDGALPGNIQGETTLDVQPDNRIVLTSEFNLLFVNPEVKIVSRLSVVDGRIEIVVEEVDPGGADILDLIGIDEWTLGDDLVDVVQTGLEQELGAGSQLLSIRTDENWIILEARLN